MRQVSWNLLRRFGSYVKVPRPDSFKIIEKPTDEDVSLAKVLHLKIQNGGPVSIAEYMRTVLTNPVAGYYIHKDVIGKGGDFITSPEISQLFGEMIGIWIAHEYNKIGSPKPWQLIELGPGKGTLMKDVLRTLTLCKATDDLSVHMVEVSPTQSKLQDQILCEAPATFGIIPRRYKENPHYKSNTTNEGIPIYWYEKLEQVPNAFSVILAHEFFDVLPIHKFQKMPEGWREVLVNSSESEGQYKFSYTLSKNETTLSKLLIREDETREHVEVSAEAGTIARHVAERLEQFGGFALFIDYGHDGEKTDTFRAFKKHTLHDPLINPGSADLTADVDFSFLREVMKDKLLTYGPVDQGDFLLRLGIDLRLDMALKNAQKEDIENIKSAYHMIVDKDKMGARYKCFAAFPAVLEEIVKPYLVEGFYDRESKES